MITWRDEAACRGLSALMWPVEGETDGQRRRRTREALMLCDGCPVRRECAAEAATYMRGTGGVMGGRVWKVRTGMDGRTYGTPPPRRRPMTIPCEDCGAARDVNAHGGIPRFCRRCTETRKAESRRRWQVEQADSIAEPCPICGRLYAHNGIDVHLAKAHGIPGMTNYARAG